MKRGGFIEKQSKGDTGGVSRCGGWGRERIVSRGGGVGQRAKVRQEVCLVRGCAKVSGL